ncbi:hypothetical protein Z517_01291 [Fonsecaea pedrosoi CBS 271.37]|uniref:Fungal-specific transcription factor domain-containing protein n=1 Tax=Fonsecaea pedrosoi CBS 271.37 TaxID=1442368 RepID=A0A0D2GXU5_9EURO|nr:uncharacterized protein Z517_01291 [Fonsecaea pedrosoi CBS 271.37]KIW85898.1 hypothetical protein Z517_01291 [Fonsecaea pedrosoi CBS 271.37]
MQASVKNGHVPAVTSVAGAIGNATRRNRHALIVRVLAVPAFTPASSLGADVSLKSPVSGGVWNPEEQRPSALKPRVDFIYTCSSKGTDNIASREGSTSELGHGTCERPQDDNADSTLCLEIPATPHPPTPALMLREESKPLFDYFINRVTISISCHKGIQDEICSVIVPMAMQVPHLLTATLALAAAHRHTSGLFEGDCQFELMKGSSLMQLRSALDRFSPSENDKVLATTLLLCLADVISPATSTSSWRPHLYGAATLSAQHSRSNGASLSSISSFLMRKYRALQAVALACCSKRFEAQILTTPYNEVDARIDDLAGYSTTLMPILEEINDLEPLREDGGSEFSCDSPPGLPHFDCSSPLEHKSHLLFDRVRALMAKRKMSRTQGGGGGHLPSSVYHDLYLVDEAYHHMALLQIFRRGSLSVPLQVIDNSRRSILDCLAAVTYQSGPCPGVATLPPLFVAGTLCTTKSDRDKVRGLLRTMWMHYGMGNVKSCQTVLQRWWKHQDESLAKAPFPERLYDCQVDDDVLPY